MLLNCKSLRVAIPLLFLSLMFSSCKIYAPTLKSLDKVKVERSGSTGYIVSSEVVIHNPNRGRIVVKGLNLQVVMNNKSIASVGKKEDVIIKRNTDFSIPLHIEVKSLESVFSDFKSVLGMFKDREVDLALKGNVKLRAFCIIRRSFPLNYSQKVKLPLFK
ncbi:MAG: LEA type 2 family protein [Bacteroidota bacterium]